MGAVFCEESGTRASLCRGLSARGERARQQFDRIRERFLAAHARRARQERLYAERYGRSRPPRSWKTRGEIATEESIDRAENRESDKMFELLDEVGGRDFRHGVPWWWVMAELTFEDAVTTGVLSVVPPAPFGCTVREVERFAQAVE